MASLLSFNPQFNQDEEGPCLEVLKSGSCHPLAGWLHQVLFPPYIPFSHLYKAILVLRFCDLLEFFWNEFQEFLYRRNWRNSLFLNYFFSFTIKVESWLAEVFALSGGLVYYLGKSLMPLALKEGNGSQYQRDSPLHPPSTVQVNVSVPALKVPFLKYCCGG